MNKSPRNRQNAKRGKSRQNTEDGPIWLWGAHAVDAALASPARKRHRLLATKNAAQKLVDAEPEIATPQQIASALPGGAVHQGVALLTDALAPVSLEEVIAARPACVAVLDQLADPHNLGAIFRSAAAFGVGAVILQTRHSPPITGVVAKSAVGAVETVREVRVVNVSRALETLADAGYATIGLEGDTEATLEQALKIDGPHAIVLGAEGAGLRPSVAGACQSLARIPMAPEMESLNVSNAAAIAFYLARAAVNT